MFIKLSLICMFVSSIIARVVGDADDVEKPFVRSARGGKFFGWQAAIPYPKFPTIKAANRRWRGEFSLSLGRLPVIATAVEFHHIRDTIPQPCHENINQIPQPPQDITSSDISFDTVSGIEDRMSTEIPLVTSTEESSALLRTLKLEDYDEITFDPTLKDDNSDEDLNAVNRVRRESENDEEIESTTAVVEMSTTAMHTTSQEADSSSNHVITTISSTLQLPHPKPPHHFHNDNKYPPSVNPHAQYVSITTTMPPPLAVKNYYDFYPSQPDLFYHYNFVPMCSSFVPMNYNFVQRRY